MSFKHKLLKKFNQKKEEKRIALINAIWKFWRWLICHLNK